MEAETRWLLWLVIDIDIDIVIIIDIVIVIVIVIIIDIVIVIVIVIVIIIVIGGFEEEASCGRLVKEKNSCLQQVRMII